MDTSIIRKLVSGDVADDAATVATFSQDASLFKITPKVVVAPRSRDDIKALVKFANDHKRQGISITARAGGTDMTGGPLNDSIILDFAKYCNHLIKFEGDRITVEPGMYYRDFEKETLSRNLLMPAYPASREICAVGGMVANNASGEKSLTYGDTGDYVERVKVILRDGQEYEFGPLTPEQLETKKGMLTLEGEMYRRVDDLIKANLEAISGAKPHVTKNSAGYLIWDVWNGHTFNLAKLFVGSQGTLGIITEITFTLIKPKPQARMLTIFLPDVQSLAEVVRRVLDHRPESFESFDDHTFALALKFLPQMIRMSGWKKVFRMAFSFLPEVGMAIKGGVPKLTLMAEFTGESETEVLERARAAEASLRDLPVTTRLVTSEIESQKFWHMRRESFSLLRHQRAMGKTAPFIDDIVVRPKDLPEFLPKLDAILKEYNLVYTIAGHIGDANFHIIPLLDVRTQEAKTIIPELGRKVYDLVFSFHGSMTGEHNDGLIRSPFLADMYGPQMFKVFEKIKNIFDPDRIFNPRKKIDADMEYAMRHLAF